MELKKTLKHCWIIVMMLGLAACASTDWVDPDDIPETPPGPEYTAEGDYMLNVVYYCPSDIAAPDKWHKRISGITLYMQAFYLKNMKRYAYNQTFNLERNVDNDTYIRIHYIKSDRPAAELKQKDSLFIANDVMEKVGAPGPKISNHYLVVLPEYEGSPKVGFFLPSGSASYPNTGFALLGVDKNTFNIDFVDTKKGRPKFLEPMGLCLRELGRSFFVPYECQRPQASYFSMMGVLTALAMDGTSGEKNIFGATPDLLQMTPTTAVSLSTCQVFSKDAKNYPSAQPDVTINGYETSYIASITTIIVECTFTVNSGSVGAVVMYSDPWWSTLQSGTRNLARDKNENDAPSTLDAISYATTELEDLGANQYRVTFEIDWSADIKQAFCIDPREINATTYVETGGMAEMRLRFITREGVGVPVLGLSEKGSHQFRIPWTTSSGYIFYSAGQVITPQNRYPIFSPGPYVW